MSGSSGDGGAAKLVQALGKSLTSLADNLETLAKKASELEGLGEGGIEQKTVREVDTYRKSILQDVRLISKDAAQASSVLGKLKPNK